jgi:HEPN domain-containing protein
LSTGDDPARLADTRAWIERAQSDLRAAHHGMKADPPLLDDVAFHCQQAVEKCFKALLAWHDVPFRKTHSLEELGQACASIERVLTPLVDRAAPLSEYAWRFRYPGEPDEPLARDVADAVAVAVDVLRGVLDLLPPDVQSGDK